MEDKAFDVHSPLVVSLDMELRCDELDKWNVPVSWAEYDLQPSNFDESYRQVSHHILDITTQIHFETQSNVYLTSLKAAVISRRHASLAR